MPKLMTITTVASFLMCVSTLNFASDVGSSAAPAVHVPAPAAITQTFTPPTTSAASEDQAPPSTSAQAAQTNQPNQSTGVSTAVPSQPPQSVGASGSGAAGTTPTESATQASQSAQPTGVIDAQPDAAAPEDLPTQVASLSQRYEQFYNENNQIQEQVKQKIEKLENENTELKNEVQTLDKQVMRLLDAQNSDASGLSRQDSIWLGVGFSVILIWLLVLTLRRQDRPVVAQKPQVDPHLGTQDETDVEDEYDYLGSEEGIAAKIDLARAYKDMGDIDQARQVLEDVLKVGNPEQKQAATELLNQIARATVN